VNIDLSTAISLATTLVVVAGSYVSTRVQLANTRDDFKEYKKAAKERADRMDARIDRQGETLTAITLQLAETGKTMRAEEVLLRMSAQDKVLAGQDKMLAGLMATLDGKASRGDIPKVTADLPPMRPRLPSRPIDREDR
jgi:hypothetical protein